MTFAHLLFTPHRDSKGISCGISDPKVLGRTDRIWKVLWRGRECREATYCSLYLYLEVEEEPRGLNQTPSDRHKSWRGNS